jgi:hypothetical protein
VVVTVIMFFMVYHYESTVVRTWNIINCLIYFLPYFFKIPFKIAI